MMKKLHQAFALTEYLVAVAVTMLLGLSLGIVQYVSGMAEDTVTGVSGSETRVRDVLTVIGDDLRNAQAYTTGSPPVKAVIADAKPTSVSLYVNTAGDTLRYYLDTSGSNPRLMKQFNGGTPTVVYEDVTAISFQYLIVSAYSAPTNGWTLAGSTLTASERSKVGAVIISVTAQFDLAKTYTRTLSTKVRLRNSPLP